MGLGDVTRAGVLAAVQECRHKGRETFLREYGFRQATTYELVLNGERYDSKAIAGVAHRYSAGELLSAESFSGGSRTVARHLRDLGFTVEEGGSSTDRAPGAAPQMVLQPRGGARVRGPINFAKSVRRGIRIADIDHLLGDQANTFAALYPDGVARLWGSTPTTQANNEKVRALRNRRVGDDVYFYANNSFIARARVLHLMDNAPLANHVWGADEDGRTWQHIMALGDIEEFDNPVRAAPVLAALGVPTPLRMLTLRSADAYSRVAQLLPARHRSGRPQPLKPLPPSLRLTAAELLNRVSSLHTHRRADGEAPSRHQPLSLLWTISRLAAGQPRLAPWSVFRSQVGPLMAEFGLPHSRVTPEYPFWHLQGSGLWEVHGIPDGAGPMPHMGTLNAAQPVAGLTSVAADLLGSPLTRLEAVVRLCRTYFADVDQRQLLDRVGFAGYATADGLLDEEERGSGQRASDEHPPTGPAPRRESTSSRPVRNAAIVQQVKELHGHACQVCETRLRYKRGPYSEAAHIRGLGSPHDGPDELKNLLCLCPNHHVLFDGLEIYVDVDGIVRRTHEGDSLGPLRVQTGHSIDDAYLQYHRTLCELNRLTTE